MRDLCTELNSPVSWRLRYAQEISATGGPEPDSTLPGRRETFPFPWTWHTVDVPAEKQRQLRVPHAVSRDLRLDTDDYTREYELKQVTLVPVTEWWTPDEEDASKHTARATPRLPKKGKRPLDVLAAAERRLFKARKRKRVERRKRKRVERPGWGWFSSVAERFHEPSGFMQYVGYHEGFAAWGWGKNGRYKWHKTGYPSVSEAFDAAESVRPVS